MDQYPFEFNFTICGTDIDLFIESLIEYGFIRQSEIVKDQFDKQLNEMSK